jgi:hypothetical protein
MLPSTLLIQVENKGASVSEIALGLSTFCVYYATNGTAPQFAYISAPAPPNLSSCSLLKHSCG